MKVGKLRELLDTLPYDTKIVVAGRDHNYHTADIVITTVLVEKYTDDLIEDFYDSANPLPEGYSKRITVLLVD